MKHILPLAIITLTLFSSCHTVKQTTEETAYAAHTDTVRLYEMHRDSVYLHDSIFQSLVVRGDTVYVTKIATKYKYRVGLRVDTVYRSRTDTLHTTDYAWKEKVVESVPWYNKALMAFLSILCVALAFIVILKK